MHFKQHLYKLCVLRVIRLNAPEEEWTHGMQIPFVVFFLFSNGHGCLLTSYCKMADSE